LDKHAPVKFQAPLRLPPLRLILSVPERIELHLENRCLQYGYRPAAQKDQGGVTMINLIRIGLVPITLALSAFTLAAPLPSLSRDTTALPLSATVPTSKPDCWVDHVQVQPGSSSGASGSENVTDAAAIGKLESSGHPGAEHRKPLAKGTTACSGQLQRRQAE
jgi:hypothetical protein